MELFSLVAVTIYCLVSLMMGVRLLRLARRTREIPELMIGLAFLTGGMLGYPFSILARVLVTASQPGAAFAAYVVAQVGMALAAFFLLLSWRRIFAPTGKLAAAFLVGWTTYLIVTVLAVIMTTQPGSVASLMTPLYWSMLVAQGGCYATLSWTSIRHAAMLKRRCALGLADPVVANRIHVWGLSNVAISFSYAYGLSAGVLLRFDIAAIYYPAIVTSFGLTSAFFVTLGFFPPRAYIARIRENAAAGSH